MSKELLDLAVQTARSAAELVRSGAARGPSVAATKTSDTDVVTEVDHRSEELIRAALVAARPDDAIMGEEGDDRPGTSGVRWIVDPIDGTINFLYGIPQYAVSIAAEVDGTVVAGVVLNVPSGVEWTAYAEPDGTLVGRCDGEPVACRPPVPLGQMLVGTGFSYQPQLRDQAARAMVRLLPRIRDIRRIGSAALDLCAVAGGWFDAYFEEGVHPWDHSAGALVAQAAGATVEVTRGAGGRATVICAPAGSFDDFRAAIADAGYLADTPAEQE